LISFTHLVSFQPGADASHCSAETAVAQASGYASGGHRQIRRRSRRARQSLRPCNRLPKRQSPHRTRADWHNRDRSSRLASAPHLMSLPICPRLLGYHTRPHHAHTVFTGIGRLGRTRFPAGRERQPRDPPRKAPAAEWPENSPARGGTRIPCGARVRGVRRSRREAAGTSGSHQHGNHRNRNRADPHAYSRFISIQLATGGPFRSGAPIAETKCRQSVWHTKRTRRLSLFQTPSRRLLLLASGLLLLVVATAASSLSSSNTPIFPITISGKIATSTHPAK
jgi:hypothetical protein